MGRLSRRRIQTCRWREAKRLRALSRVKKLPPASTARHVSVLVAGDKVAGLIAMREPCPDAEAGIQALKAAGIARVMLTGDNGPVRAC